MELELWVDRPNSQNNAFYILKILCTYLSTIRILKAIHGGSGPDLAVLVIPPAG